ARCVSLWDWTWGGAGLLRILVGPGGGWGGRGGALYTAGAGARSEAGRDDVRLTAWTDHRRAAVVALAGADGVPAPLLSSGPAPPSGR
ncbi:hypothetical protein ACFWJY_33710, partial [Streptomyces anulatus]